MLKSTSDHRLSSGQRDASLFYQLLVPLLAGFMTCGIPSQVVGQKMSTEGEQRKAAHDYLFQDFSKERNVVYRETARGQGLKELTVLENSRIIHNGDELLLPSGAEDIAVFFRHMAFRGTDLDAIEKIIVLPFSPDKAPPRSQQVKDFYRVQMPSIPTADRSHERMKIRFYLKDPTSECTVETVIFIAQSPILTSFDTIPYRDLGSELPREHVPIGIDTDRELWIGETSRLQRHRWFRFHDAPGAVDQSFEKWASQRNFLPGRNMLKFQPGLTTAWGDWEPLHERSDAPGTADLSFFATYDSGTRNRNAIPAFKDIAYASCFNDWPDFMSVPLIGRGTPQIEHFDDAAELAAAYVKDQIRDGGYTAKWWEVKNESSFQSEWAYHWREKEGLDGWGLLSDFHNRVADAIHKQDPTVCVGGPAAAYMQLHQKDFSLFRDHARFIKETRGKIDFFSYHFYENAHTLGAYERRGHGYTNYLLGRYEATLDMLRAEMHNADNVLPILITECGSLQNGRRASDNWLRLLAWNAFLTKTMQRPDQIGLFVPFIFLHMPWNPLSGDAAFTPQKNKNQHISIEDFDPTTIANFFELWRDFDGRRLPTSFDHDWLDVVALYEKDHIAVAITNVGGRQLSIDLSAIRQRFPDTSARQTRLNYNQGNVTFQPPHTVDLNAIPVDVNETTVIHLLTKENIQPVDKIRLQRHYATQTAVKSDGAALTFYVQTPHPEQIVSAKLVVGIHRTGGVTTPIKATLNSTPITIDTGNAAEFSDFFAPLTAKVVPSVMKNNNTVTVTVQPGATVTSLQIEATSTAMGL